MKKIILLCSTICFIFVLTGCGADAEKQQREQKQEGSMGKKIPGGW